MKRSRKKPSPSLTHTYVHTSARSLAYSLAQVTTIIWMSLKSDLYANFYIRCVHLRWNRHYVVGNSRNYRKDDRECILATEHNRADNEIVVRSFVLLTKSKNHIACMCVCVCLCVSVWNWNTSTRGRLCGNVDLQMTGYKIVCLCASVFATTAHSFYTQHTAHLLERTTTKQSDDDGKEANYSKFIGGFSLAV